MTTEALKTMEQAIADRIGEIATDLFTQHSSGIAEARGDENKVTVRLSYTLRQTSDGVNVKAKISYGTKHTDEREDNVNDPRQEKLFTK